MNLKLKLHRLIMIKILFLITLVSGCSLMAPNAGTHYSVKYDNIEVEVDDYTDRKGVQFEYVNKNGTRMTLKKSSVDTTTPAAAIAAKSAENQAAALALLDKVISSVK